MVGASVYALFARGQLALIAAQMGGAEVLLPLLALMLGFFQSTIATSCVSISLEGKTLWILKEAPIAPAALFGAKALLNILLSCGSSVVGVTLLSIALELPLAGAAGLVLLALTFGTFMSLAGLVANLYFPKLDCDNDTIVVKQSASAFCGIFGGWLMLGIGAGAWALVNSFLSFAVFCVAMALVLGVACALIWRWLRGRGAQMLIAL